MPVPALPTLLVVAAAWVVGLPICVADSPSGPAKEPVLHLVNGGFVAGELEASPRAGVLRWKGSAFVEPFEFPLDQVGIVQWPSPATLPRPEGVYGFELSGGDVLFGSLADLDGAHATLEVPRFGRVRVARSHLHRILRWGDGADMIYYGPSGLSEWTARPPEGAWREEAGQPITERDGATLVADLGLPAKAVVEFEISWKATPDFVLALGIDKEEEAKQVKPGEVRPNEAPGFRFEVWEGELVVVRETGRGADLASVGKVASGEKAGRIHLLAYVDQERGRILVDSPEGTRLADLEVPPDKPHVGPALSLINVDGDVRLERLAIRRWDGEVLPTVEANRPHIVRVDGSTVFGDVARYDAEAKVFVVAAEGGETRVPSGEVAAVVCSAPGEAAARDTRVVYQDGTRLSGTLARVGDGTLELQVPGVEEKMLVPVAGLRSLVVLRHGEATPPDAGLIGRLELDGVELRGVLVDGQEGPEASCLAWRPLGGESASHLRHGASGRVVYKDTKPAPPPQAAAQPVPPRPAPAGILQRIFPPRPAGQAPRPASVRPMLYLRSGDIIPAEVTKIDEDGLWFKTPISENTFVPHDKIKAAVLGPENSATVRVNKTKRERLLTLPRMQKGSPPTHLIRSRNGDYLRGRVVGMDGESLRVELHLEEKSVPREFVTRIIWLHPDELGPSEVDDEPGPPAVPEPPAKDAATRVQAVRSDGIRLTFLAERAADGALDGKSDVLGDCRVPLADVDQLVFGSAIERAAAQLAYNLWKLQNAPEPKTLAGGEPGADGSTGMESALVGKPAPDFTLDLLGGKAFHLAESKGQVVVLDFWATWCGPCLQSMPQVEEATREFQDRGVKLIAVNLQEAPEQISAMLERHKLPLTVALDRDGAVAQRYGANAIPQTVIIDREGNVARLYIGASPHLGEQIRTSIEALLAEGGEKAPNPGE